MGYYANRIGTEITLDLESPEAARGLHAFMNNAPDTVPKQVFELGAYLYGWLASEVAQLAATHETESATPYKKKPRKKKE